MKGKFDISWKGILALFIVLTFLLSAVDLVVHGAEVPANQVETEIVYTVEES